MLNDGQTLLVTGMQRSGTTLLDKLLDQHPAVSLLSQPFPLLLIEAKRTLFQTLGHAPPRYALDPLFRETRYAPDDLNRFLKEFRIDRRWLENVFAEMRDFSGQYTRFPSPQLERALAIFQPGPLAETLIQLYRLLSSKTEAVCYGGKETLGEEFLPYLLDQGIKAILILRDPRAVLASLNCSEGHRFAGAFKPTLFNLRHWRKSVAFALHLDSHPGFCWFRYEDLVTEPWSTLDRLTDFLGIAPFARDTFKGGIRDRDGRLWEGNSSHGVQAEISAASLCRYHALLSGNVIAFVEACCYPELRTLNYPLTVQPSKIPAILRNFEDPYAGWRAELADYRPNPQTLADEIERFEAWKNRDAAKSRDFFLFEDVLERLCTPDNPKQLSG